MEGEIPEGRHAGATGGVRKGAKQSVGARLRATCESPAGKRPVSPASRLLRNSAVARRRAPTQAGSGFRFRRPRNDDTDSIRRVAKSLVINVARKRLARR